MSKTRGVPDILPRERLTTKAAAGIVLYAILDAQRRLREHERHSVEDYLSGEVCLADHGFTATRLVVRAALRAERMRREDLYAWLGARGWNWNARAGVWRER